jgi:hypothetical protein
MSTPTQESLIKIYMQHIQSIVSEDSDSEGPADLFDDYDDVFDFDTPSVSTDDENIQRRSQQ